MMSRLVTVLTLALLALPSLGARPATAQTVRGRLLEGGTDEPITSGLVVLLDTLGTEVARAETDERGRFVLEAPEPGSYLIRGERLGYRPKVDGILDLGEGGEMTVVFYLRPQPIALDPLEVTGERDLIRAAERRFLEGQGFYDRMKQGFGDFITPEELEEIPFPRFEDMFRRIPGRVQVRWVRGLESIWIGGCRAATYVNGVRVGLELGVDAQNVAAAEIYRRASSIPLEYQTTDSETACGVVLIWTKG